MGYDIIIGQAVTNEAGQLRAERVRREDAPTFVGDEMTANSNYRAPSYGGWTDFTRDVGLYELFFGPKGTRGQGLMGEHPGCVALTRSHQAEIATALDRYRALNSEAYPGWGFGQDPQLARLVWLNYWVSWALDNVPEPVICNY